MAVTRNSNGTVTTTFSDGSSKTQSADGRTLVSSTPATKTSSSSSSSSSSSKTSSGSGTSSSPSSSGNATTNRETAYTFKDNATGQTKTVYSASNNYNDVLKSLGNPNFSLVNATTYAVNSPSYTASTYSSDSASSQAALAALAEAQARYGAAGTTPQEQLPQVPQAPNYSVPTQQQTALRGLALGDLYGLNYNYNDILSKLNNATNASYAVKEQEATQNENAYYNKMVDTQSVTLDTLRRAQAKAVATGASKGMAAANELSSVLGLQDTMSEEANLLANERNNIITEKQASVEKNASSALETSNAIRQAIAGLDSNLYGYDTQNMIGYLDYLASLANSDAMKYNSDTTLSGVKYNADQNLAATQATVEASKNAAANYTYGSGYTGASGGSGSGGSSGTETTATPTEKAGTKIAVPDTNTYFVAEADGTYTLYSPDESGNYQPTSGYSKTQKDTILKERSTDALNANYPAQVLGSDFNNGKINIGRITWTYDWANNIWKSSAGMTTTTAGMKQILDNNKADSGTGSTDTSNFNLVAVTGEYIPVLESTFPSAKENTPYFDSGTLETYIKQKGSWYQMQPK